MKLEKGGVAIGGGLLGFFGATFLWTLILAHFDLPQVILSLI